MTDFSLIEGFDYYNGGGTTNGGYRSVWTGGGSGDWLTGTGRFGVGQRCRLGDATGNTAYIQRTLPGGAIGPDFAIGFAYSQNGDGVSQLFYTRNGATEQLNLRHIGGGNFGLYLNATLLGTTGAIMVGNNEAEWVWFDIVGTLADSGGHVEVWVNNVKKIDFTGDTTNGAAVFDRILLRCPDGTGASNWSNFDDLLIWPVATRIGDSRIDYQPVNGDTADKDFTPSTGSDNYALLDEVPMAVADYVTAINLGDKDVYEVTNLSADTSSILAAQGVILFDKTDAGARELEVQIISAAADESGIVVPGTTANMAYGPCVDVDPNTSAPWTYGGFNAMKLGLEVTT